MRLGGAGIVTGESFGAECVVFEPGSRHSFQEAIGRNIANPTAMLLSAANMLNYLHMKDYGEGLERAVKEVLSMGKVRTRDLGGYSTTTEFTDAVIDRMTAIMG